MNTRFLETFVTLNRLKSFSRTAEHLHSTQPAISGRIVALENLFGVSLYDRSHKGFELTDAGRRILNHCERIVEMARQLPSLASGDSHAPGTVRIGASDVISLSWMPELKEVLEGRFPTATFEIVTGDSVFLTQALAADKLDLALVANCADGPATVNRPLCSYRVRWMASPSKFDVHTPISVRQLCGLPIIMPPPTTPGYQWQVDYMKRHSFGAFEAMNTKMQISCGLSPATAIEMVRAGLGVMPLPVLLARRWIERQDLALLPVDEPFPPWKMSVAFKTPPTFPEILDVATLAQEIAQGYARQHGGEDFW